MINFRIMDWRFSLKQLDLNTRYQCSVQITQAHRSYVVQTFRERTYLTAIASGHEWFDLFFNRYEIDKVTLEIVDTWEEVDSPYYLLRLENLWEAEERTVRLMRSEVTKF